MQERQDQQGLSAKSSQPRFNNREEFENSVMEFFQEKNQAFNLQEPERMDFARGLDISKIKVRLQIFLEVDAKDNNSYDDVTSIKELSLLDPAKHRRMDEIDRKINEVFGAQEMLEP